VAATAPEDLVLEAADEVGTDSDPAILSPVAAKVYQRKSFLEELESFVPDPEVQPAPEAEADQDSPAAAQATGAETDEAGSESTGAVADEFIDESNPFYAAKKAQKSGAVATEETAKAAAPSYKDSSDAANAILRKMMDRRRQGK
jgi:hypothetical protein